MSEKINKLISNEQELLDFLLYSYFGIDNVRADNCTGGQIKEEVAIKCAERAYLDLARTLTFDEELKGKENKKKENVKRKFRNEICEGIVKDINNMLFCDELLRISDEEKKREEFDKKHDLICKNIIANAKGMKFQIDKTNPKFILENKEGEQFYYGQAQKWLNMTLKYMRLIGLWKPQIKNLKTCLHVPVDSFIMEAAAGRNRKDKDKSTLGENIKLKCRDGEKRFKYREGNSEKDPLPWSQWKKEEYSEFQTDIRTKLDAKTHPIIWENEKWIEVAKKRAETEDDVNMMMLR